MPRIPPAELARLKSEISVEQLVRAKGVKLIRRGKDLHGRCPHHEDKTPSLVVSPEVNLWNCLGACQAGGGPVDWVMKSEGVSFRHAVEILRADLPAFAGSDEAPVIPAKPKLPKLASPDLEDQALLRRTVSFYHQTLKENPDALEYLAERGLTHPDLVDHFRLGFANRTLGYRLPAKTTKEGRRTRERLQGLGVLRKSGHEHLAGSLVVPLTDEHGQVVQLYGRKTGKRLRKGTAHHLYLPGPQRGVLNREALAHSEDLILCESILDALTFWCAGLRNVTCTYSAGGLHPDLKEALQASGIRRVFVAYDRDKAGDAGAKKVAKELAKMGLAAYRVLLPRGLDVNEYASKVEPAGKALELAVRHAEWMGEGPAPETAEAAEPGDTAKPVEAAKEEGDEPGDSEPAASGSARESAPASSLEAPSPPEPSSLAAIPSVPANSEPVASTDLLSESLPTLTWLGDEAHVTLGDRQYRIRGRKLREAELALKVNLRVSRSVGKLAGAGAGAGFHVDTLDLYQARPREVFASRAAAQLGCEEATVLRDLGRVLDLLEQAQAEAQAEEKAGGDDIPAMSEAERREAMALLAGPRLLERILEDYRRCGVVGEETNKLVGYLAAVSRKLLSPLAVVIQSSSAAGKSSLMDAVLQFMPKEERVSYSAMTGQSLFYMSETNLAHKILAIAEEEGAQKASYALKLLQSEGELTIASTGKDALSGRLTTHEYHVEGPVMIFLTTTAIDMDEELLNRCLVLTVDEGRDQTRAIHHHQRERQTLDGVFADEEREELVRIHRNAQRLLRPLRVVNPYAHELTFLDHRTRSRRDHTKYLTLIQAITLLHQYQREVKTERRGEREVTYVEVTREDIATANRLFTVLLGRSLDELPPQTRRLLAGITQMVEARCEAEGVPREEIRFTRREVRQWTGVGNTQAKVHLKRLEELEYLLVHLGGRGQSLVYELLVPDGEDPDPTSPQGYDEKWAGQTGQWAGGCRAQVGGVSAPSRGVGGVPEASLETAKKKKESDSFLERKGPGDSPSRRTVPAGTNGTRPPTTSEA